jgi:hypothetical protein
MINMNIWLNAYQKMLQDTIWTHYDWFTLKIDLVSETMVEAALSVYHYRQERLRYELAYRRSVRHPLSALGGVATRWAYHHCDLEETKLWYARAYLQKVRDAYAKQEQT